MVILRKIGYSETAQEGYTPIYRNDSIACYEQYEEVYSTDIGEGSKRRWQLMNEDLLTLKFSSESNIILKVGDFVWYNNRRFILTEPYRPSDNADNGGYDYDIPFEADYRYAANRIFKLSGKEPGWSLTGDMYAHLEQVRISLQAEGMTYRYIENGKICEKDFDYYIQDYTPAGGDNIQTSIKPITYSSKSILDSITLIAETWKCEWWFDAYVLNMGKCEVGEYVNFHRDYLNGEAPNIESIDGQGTSEGQATRLYVYGSKDNIPSRYDRKLIFHQTNISTESGYKIFYDKDRLLNPGMFTEGEGVVFRHPLDYRVTGSLSGGGNKTQFPVSLQGTSNVTINMDVTGIVGVNRRWSKYKVEARIYSDNSARYFSIISEELPSAASGYNFSLAGSNILLVSGRITIEIIGYGYNGKTYETLDNSVDRGMLIYLFNVSYDIISRRVAIDTVVNFGGVDKNCTINPTLADESEEAFSQVSVATGDYSSEPYTLPKIDKYKVPVEYFTTDNPLGYSERRLHMDDTDEVGDDYIKHGVYIQDKNISDEEVVESILILDDIKPNITLKVVNVNKWTSEERTEEGVKTHIYYDIAIANLDDTPFEFSIDSILKGETLRARFMGNVDPTKNSKLNGMDFDMGFYPQGRDGLKDYQEFEIVNGTIEDNEIPNSVLYPQVGDQLVLYGWDVQSMTMDTLVSNAQTQLKQEAIKWLRKNKIDAGTYTCPMFSDVNNQYEIGRKVKLYSPLFEGGFRVSRIVGAELNLDLPWDTPVYTIAQEVSYATQTSNETLGTIQNIEKGPYILNPTGNKRLPIYIDDSHKAQPIEGLDVPESIRSGKSIEAMEGMAAYGIASMAINGGGGRGTVTSVSVNGTVYTPSDGLITLPDYPSLAGYATESYVANYFGANFTQANIKNTLGISDWALAANKPSYNFSEIGNKPNTLAGYGISDAHITDGVITLGQNTITPATLVSGKIPLSQIPDAILGQMLYGGTVNGSGVVTLSQNAKDKWGITSLTLTSTNYADYQGAFFIADANGSSGVPSTLGVLVGDWIVATASGWGKIDNTDAVTGVKGDAESSYRIGNVNITPANIGLGNVRNIDIYSWDGRNTATSGVHTSAITHLGTIAYGVWQGTAIADTYISSANAWNAKYDKPSTGIPKTDLASGVQTSLGLADTALQSHQTIYNLVVKNSGGTTEITYKPATSGTYELALTKAMVGLGNVENTALSTWAGTSNITTLGTITTGVWNGTAIAVANGGTGATTAADARTNLGLGTASTHAYGDFLTYVGFDNTNLKFKWSKGGVAESAFEIGYAAKTGQLYTSRTIWGQSFNGSANVTGYMRNVTEIDELAYFDTTGRNVNIGTAGSPADLNVMGGVAALGIASMAINGGGGTVTGIKIGTGSIITPTDGIITIPMADTSTNGAMSSADKSKLNGIEANANNYVLPAATANALGGIKVGTNLSIDGNGVLSAVDTTYTFYNLAFQNASGTQVDIYKPTTSPSKTIKAGSNVTISASSNVITIAATDTTYESKAAASGGTAVSLVTTGEKYTWNNKQNAISDLSTIRSRADEGHTAYGWGNHADAGYFAASSFTKANIKSTLGISDWALVASKPSYTHNEIGAGNLTIGDGANVIFLRTDTNWASAIYHQINSAEAVVFLNRGLNVSGMANYTTSWIFAYGKPTDRPAWNTLTPAMQIKGQSVVINKLLGSRVGASYNLDVNGTLNATTIYQNGTALATVATSGSYNDLSDKPTIPTVNNGNLYLQASGTTKTTFTANQSGNSTFNIATGSANGTLSIGGTDVAVKGLGASAYVGYDTTVTKDSAKLITSGAVWTAIDNLPEPMVFKGSLGTGGTITALPTNGSASIGDTYKVITVGTYASKAAKVGDTFICLTKTSSANTWELIPSGDEPSGTVTSVGLSVPTGLSVSGSPITSSGTLAITFASGYSIPTTAKQGNWDTAYGWGNHASAGYALASNLGTASTHAHGDYVTAIGTSGNTLTWSKGGTAQTAITVPYATNANYATTAGSAPASDVYAWAKAASKPSYHAGELDVTPTSYKVTSVAAGIAPYISDIGTNIFSGATTSEITVERSLDNGATWTDVTSSEAANVKNVFSGCVSGYLAISGHTKAVVGDRLRITFNPSGNSRYCQLAFIYVHFNTNGCGCLCNIEKNLYTDKTAWTTYVADAPMAGWSGPNIVGMGSTIFGQNDSGNNGYGLRFTFRITSVNANYDSRGYIYTIQGFTANKAWGYPSGNSIAKTNTPYTYVNADRAVSFDNTVAATGFYENGTALSSKYLGINANAVSATKATNDSDGNAINTTYLKLSGGTLTGTGTILTLSNTSGGDVALKFLRGGNTAWSILNSGGNLSFIEHTTGKTVLKLFESRQGLMAQLNGHTMWHAGNDGTGSTLDADLLDGQHGSYYAVKVASKGSTTKPIYTDANGAFQECSTYAGGTAVTLNGTSKAASTASFYAPTGAGTSGQILKSTAGAPEWINQSSITAGALTTVSKTAWGQTFWTSGGVPTSISGNMSNVGDITPSANDSKSIGSSSLQFQYLYGKTLATSSSNGLSYCASNGRHRWYANLSPDSSYKQMELDANSNLTVNGNINGLGGVAAMGIASMAINSLSGVSFASQIVTNGQTYTATSGQITLPNFTDAYNPSGTGSTTQALSQKGAKDLYNALNNAIPSTSTVAGWGYKKGMVYSTSTPSSDGDVIVATGADPTYQFVTNTSKSSLVLSVTTSGVAANTYGVHRYIMIYNNRSSATTVSFADPVDNGVIGPADSVSIPANSYMEFSIIQPASNAKCMVTWSQPLKNVSTL